ncbi:MAG: hypothetical protein ACI97K_001072 [Glaciecola sp.]
MSSAFKTVVFFAAMLAGLTWFFSTMLGPDTSGVSRTNNGEIRYFGPIDMDRVEKFKRLYQPGDRLLVNSNGGSLHAGIEMGNFIHQKRMTVEVIDLCISSCANYIFLAGETKVLNKNALVVFHGGPKQANFLSLMEQAEYSNAEPGTTFGRADYEGVVTIEKASRQRAANANNPCARNEIMNFDGECQQITVEQRLNFVISLEESLYQTIDPALNRSIPYLGQLGDYESIYSEYQYYGFYYSLESLSKLNVTNVFLKEDTWTPQNNPLFEKVYEVGIN